MKPPFRKLRPFGMLWGGEKAQCFVCGKKFDLTKKDDRIDFENHHQDHPREYAVSQVGILLSHITHYCNELCDEGIESEWEICKDCVYPKIEAILMETRNKLGEVILMKRETTGDVGMNRNQYLLSLLRRTFGGEPIEETLLVLTYELGDLAKHLIYAKRNQDRLHLVDAKTAIADMIAQLRIVAAKLGYDFDELDSLGFQRFCETMALLRRRGKN